MANVKDKVKAETMEVLETTKANLKMATGVMLHPFDKDKKAQAKEEARIMKEEAREKKAASLGKTTAPEVPKHEVYRKQAGIPTKADTVPFASSAPSTVIGEAPIKDKARSSSSSSSSSEEASEERQVLAEPPTEMKVAAAAEEQATTGTVPKEFEIPPDPTQPIFMTGA